jgi:hypothetical protein
MPPYSLSTLLPRAILVVLGLLLPLALAQKPSGIYRLVFKAGEASCQSIEIHTAAGQKLVLPQEIERALRCSRASLSPDGKILLYMAANRLMAYQLSQRKSALLHRVAGYVLRGNESKYLSGLDFFWSPDSQRFALLLISQNQLFPLNTHVRVFDLQGIVVKQRKDFDLDVAFVCGSDCTALNAKFLNRTQWRYQTKLKQTVQHGQNHFAVLQLKR